MLGRWRRAWPAVAGVGVLAGLALLDFVVPRGSWYADHPMSAAALSGFIAFLAAGVFLDGWMREREARRLDRIATIAYRSLAQYVNDAGRSLLAPLNGADLHELGIPLADPGDSAVNRDLLLSRGHVLTFEEDSGSWREVHDRAATVLQDLVDDPAFVRRMFRITASMRRRMQEATALWAPVMLTSKRSADDLGRMQELTDSLELLQERWRSSGLVARTVARWEPDELWRAAAVEQFWSTIEIYESLRDEFAELARLPSDEVVRGRRVADRARDTPVEPPVALPADVPPVGSRA